MNTLLSKIENEIKNSNFFEAENLSWSLYQQNKNDLLSIKTLALCLLLQNKYYGSIDFYTQVFQKEPNDFNVVNNLAHLNLKIEEFEKSLQFSNMALKIDDTNYLPYVTLLDLHLRKRDFEEGCFIAEELLKRITHNVLNENPNIVYLVLDVFLAANKKDQALKYVNYFYKKSFSNDIFYYHSTFGPESMSENLIEGVLKISEKDDFNNAVIKGKKIAPLYFGLAKYYEKKKNIKKSDEYYIKANSQIKDVLRYQPLSNQKLINNIKKNFSNEISLDYIEHNDECLIFIVGMPRSGTTLVESIVASANNTISGGELRSIYELFKSRYDEDDSDSKDSKDPGSIYLNRINFIRQDHKYFIDKLPGNFHNIGFIKKIFPKSKIIYLKRDPWDNAISLFKQFYVANIPYSASFFNIGVMYANHEEIMRFWKNDMNLDFLTIEYEKLVQDTVKYSQIIYDYCGFDQKYNPEERKGFFARTASKNQVNKDVYTDSIGKKSFENLKDEFLNSLNNQREYWGLK